jgi:hypothetical protein
VLYKVVSNEIKYLTEGGNYNSGTWEKNLEEYNGNGYQIQDGNTINQLFEGIEVNLNGIAPKASKGWTPVVYKKESYTGRYSNKSVTIYVFFYYLTEPENAYKYVVNGSMLELSNGVKLKYSGNKLIYDDYNTYTKR